MKGRRESLFPSSSRSLADFCVLPWFWYWQNDMEQTSEDLSSATGTTKGVGEKLLRSEMKGIGLFILKGKQVRGWLYLNTGRVLEGHWSTLLHVQGRLVRSSSFSKRQGNIQLVRRKNLGKDRIIKSVDGLIRILDITCPEFLVLFPRLLTLLKSSLFQSTIPTSAPSAK